MLQRNLAVELLRKLLQGEIRTRGRKNVVQARRFSEMLERAIRRYQNRAIDSMQVIEELIALAREMRDADRRGEDLGLTEEELAFYEALEANDSAVKVPGEPTFKRIAQETGRSGPQENGGLGDARECASPVASDGETHPEEARVPSGQQEKATQLVLEQTKVLSAE